MEANACSGSFQIIYIYIYIYNPTPEDVTQYQFFKSCLTGLNSKFSFYYTHYYTKIKDPSLPYYLLFTEG